MKTLYPFSPLARDYALPLRACKAPRCKGFSLGLTNPQRQKGQSTRDEKGGRGQISEKPWHCKGSRGFDRGILTVPPKIGERK